MMVTYSWKKIVFILTICGLAINTAGMVKAAVNSPTNGATIGAPKKVVAVADFENKANYAGKYDLGKGMAEMLTDALMKSGQFIVLERQALDAVFAEQNLAASGRASKVGGAKQGDIKRAQILIQGAITEYAATASGGGQSLNIGGFSVGGDSEQAHIAVIIRLFDTTTSEVIASERVEGKASRGGMKFDVSERNWGFSQSGKKAEPIDKAVQIAIDNAVHYISMQMATIPWQGKVIKAGDDGLVYLNAGINANVQNGMTFMIFRPGEELIDPDTGMNLGTEEQFVGRLRITDVQPKFSKGEAVDSKPAVGDIVKFTH